MARSVELERGEAADAPTAALVVALKAIVSSMRLGLLAIIAAVLAGCWDPTMHYLFYNQSGTVVTLYLRQYDRERPRPYQIRVGPGKSRLFMAGNTEHDLVLRLSAQGCEYVYNLPDDGVVEPSGAGGLGCGWSVISA